MALSRLSGKGKETKLSKLNFLALKLRLLDIRVLKCQLCLHRMACAQRIRAPHPPKKIKRLAFVIWVKALLISVIAEYEIIF